MSTTPLCAFTDTGIQAFRECLTQMKARSLLDLPSTLLTDSQFSRPVDESLQVEFRDFANTREMIQYLHPIVTTLDLPDKFYNTGLWAWLSAFYFDVVCPKKHGSRNPGEEARHILKRSWRDSYRHLIAAPLRIYDAHGDELTHILLYPHPSERSEFLREIMGVQELAMNPSILDALRILFWDQSRGRPKRGALDKKGKPGTLRRFIAVVNQFNLTFDLFAMSGEQIVKLLPEREFGKWLNTQG
ncbi:hypothetical protein ANRL4_03957 [Anaerolineae bacterium]|nr:hypothetical protein ANRL4_03957 [Anaerolineae bacterium]